MTRPPFSATLLLLALALAACRSLPAAAPSDVQGLLEHEIVGSQLPWAEVQQYCDARVPPMPEVNSVAEWEKIADRIRRDVLEGIVYRGGATKWRDAETRVEWLDTIEGGPGYRIKKLRYEALPGLWIPALLYAPEKLAGKVPAVLNVNGHTALGKQYPPKQIRSINQAKRGMLALNLEWLGMGQLKTPGFTHYRMNQIDLCGTSGLAPFYLAMKRGLDILVGLENADPERVAVTGLSGGGWQTIIISSLDTRVKLTDPVAGYSSFRTRAYHTKDLGDSEQTPNDLATVCDYTHLTAMMAPRPTLLTYNLHDSCCFEGEYALQPLLDAAQPIFRLYGREDALRSHVNDDPPGKHNYEVDNRQQLYRMLGDFFYPGDQAFDATEIPSDDEVKSEEELHVALPEKNEDFNTLALRLAKDLPREPARPGEKDAAAKWQASRRAQLSERVRAKPYEVHAIPFGKEERSGVKATYWKLQMGAAWTVPAVELVQGGPQKTAILVADEGRQGAAADAARLLGAGYRVLAVDPFYFGESKIRERDFLYALLVAAVGERPLGLQASQVAAVARWSAAEHEGPAALVALGPRSSTFALVAAALEPKAVGAVELHNPLGSLKQVIEESWGVNEKPELFCFGLLEAFDVEHVAALVAPRRLVLVDADERAKAELSDLDTWCRMLGGRLEFTASGGGGD